MPKEWQQSLIPNGHSRWMKDEHPPPPEMCRNNIMTPILQSLALPCGSPFPRCETVKRAQRESKSVRSVLILDSAETFFFFFKLLLFCLTSEKHVTKEITHFCSKLLFCTTNANLAAGAFSCQNDLPEEMPTEINSIVIYPVLFLLNNKNKGMTGRLYWRARSGVDGQHSMLWC